MPPKTKRRRLTLPKKLPRPEVLSQRRLLILDVNRTANEITSITITATVGRVWAQPLYDRAEKMISLLGPQEPTAVYTATCDAWN